MDNNNNDDVIDTFCGWQMDLPRKTDDDEEGGPADEAAIDHADLDCGQLNRGWRTYDQCGTQIMLMMWSYPRDR